MSLVGTAASVVLGAGGLAGVATALQVRATNRRIVGDARKASQEGGEAYVRASDLSVDSMADVIEHLRGQIQACYRDISDLKRERDDLRAERNEYRLERDRLRTECEKLTETGEALVAELAEIRLHVEQIEERKGDWRRPPAES